MGTTAVNQPMEQTAEAQGVSVAQVAEPVVGVVRGLWYLSVGLVAVAGEQTGRAVKTLIEKGRQVQPAIIEQGKKAGEGVSDAVGEVGEKLKGLTTRVGRVPEAAEEMLDQKVGAALQRLGFPTKEEMAQLSAKLDGVVERLEALQGSKKSATNHEDANAS